MAQNRTHTLSKETTEWDEKASCNFIWRVLICIKVEREAAP